MSIQRMGLKMEFIAGNMKTMQNNQAIMGSFDKMTQMLGYSNNPNFEMMSNNLQNFEKTMDEMLINGKMMEELMSNQNGIVDSTADDMLNVLKGELAMETSNQVNEAALIKQKEMEFQEDLKKL
jgi:charged multivesicular body protein 1